MINNMLCSLCPVQASGTVEFDTICCLAGWHKRPLNQALVSLDDEIFLD